MKRSLAFSSAIFSFFTFISRILGLLRDQLIAVFFGASGATDAFFVAFKIPNFFRRLFGESAFAQVFIPILSQAKNESEEKYASVVNHIGTKFFLLVLILSIFITIFAPLFIVIFAWGFYSAEDLNKYNLASEMLAITGPYLFFISMVAFTGSILNLHEKFSIQAFSPIILNVVFIVSIIYFRDFFDNPIMTLPWAVFFGGIFQLLFQLPFLVGLIKKPQLKFKIHPYERTFFKRMVPIIFGVSITQLNLFFDIVIATFLTTGSITWLYFSDRFLELPVALIGISIATIALTHLANAYNSGDQERFIRIIKKASNIAIIFGIPAMFGLIILSEQVITTLIEYKSFTVLDTLQTSKSLIAYSCAIIGFIFIKILSSIFLSMGLTKPPVICSAISLVINIILSIILSKYYGHVGIALATSIASYINLILLLLLLKKRMALLDILDLNLLFKIIFSSILMSLFIYLYAESALFYHEHGMVSKIIYLLKDIILAIGLYFLTLRLLKVKVTQ